MKYATRLFVLSSLLALEFSVAAGASELKLQIERLFANDGVAEAIEQLESRRQGLGLDLETEALLGRAYSLDRRFLAAEPLLARVVEEGAADLSTLLAFASVLWENGHLEGAETRYREAVKLSNAAAEAVFPLAKLLVFRGKVEEAIPLFEDVRRSYPRRLDVALEYGRTLAEAGDSADAATELEAFIAFAPEHSEALYALAQVYSRLDRRSDAEVLFERFRRVSGEDRQRVLDEGRRRVELDQAASFLTRDEPRRALEVLSRLPESIDTLRMKARSLLALKNPAAAIEALEAAVSMDPSRVDVRLELQQAYQALRNSQ